MRIVAGEFRGRRLRSPKTRNIRPTSDRVREAIFNMIMAHLPEAAVLDLFAGTGALGLEALSRGAARAVFVDQNAGAVRLILDNVKICGVQERAEVIHGAVDQVIRRLAKSTRMIGRFQVVFLDPPYGKDYVQSTIELLSELASPTAIVVAEHHTRDAVPLRSGDWVLTRQRRYGDTKVSFYMREIPPAIMKAEADQS